MLETLVSSGLSEYGLPCSAEALSRFRLYYEALEETGKIMNLTAIHGEEAVAQLHFLDCAYPATLLDLSGKKIFDIGTGAGFPGMVLKILSPGADLTLMDSLDKRIHFLKNTAALLNLQDIQCLHVRAEEIPPSMRETADVVTSRAVASLNVLAELCLPYVKAGGVFLAMKGPDFEEELEQAKSAIKALGGKCEACKKYTIPGTEISHSVIMIRKLAATPPRFPRRWAQIKKLPL